MNREERNPTNASQACDIGQMVDYLLGDSEFGHVHFAPGHPHSPTASLLVVRVLYSSRFNLLLLPRVFVQLFLVDDPFSVFHPTSLTFVPRRFNRRDCWSW